jgi:hypothetical protein
MTPALLNRDVSCCLICVEEDGGGVELPDHDNVRHGVMGCRCGVSDE